MGGPRLAILSICLILAAGCAARPAQPPGPPTGEAPRLVEEFWPNGELRLRKSVVASADGSVVDHGRFERWYDNGVKEYEAVFEYGNKQGATVRYHRNGQQADRQEYRDGKRHGPSVSWDASGVKVKEEQWADGRPHGTWTIWKNGKVQWRHTYDEGIPAP